MAGLVLPPALLEAIKRLQALKLVATEADTIEVPTEIGLFLAEALAQPAPRAAAWDKSGILAAVDQAFLRIVMGQRA